MQSDTSEDLVIGDKVIKDCYPINVDLDLPIIQLAFESYIAYSVTNESYTSWDDYEVFEGNAFRIYYTKSRFLDFIKVHTFAYDAYRDMNPPLTHYGIVCLNHIINIVSTVTPRVSETRYCQQKAERLNVHRKFYTVQYSASFI